MKRCCIVCQEEFEGESWMKRCRNCYRDYRNHQRIERAEGRIGVVIVAPVRYEAQEIDEWIDQHLSGGCPSPSNWGVNIPLNSSKWKMKSWLYFPQGIQLPDEITVFDKKMGRIFQAHPSVTEEEIYQWIEILKKKLILPDGECILIPTPLTHNFWWNCQNTD